jgi:4-amino-4-deoxy-L-arabinose transferase-like glycosyltransferase
MPASENSSRFTQHWPLLLLIIAYLIVVGLFAARTPPWQAPDEPAHYNYAAQVAQDGCCPTIQVGDWDSPYLEQLKSAHFAPDLLDKFDTIQYEDHQPPLYYLAQSLVYKISSGDLVAMRFFSALLGLGIVICAYFIVLLLLPGRTEIALGAAAFVAFLPQHIAILASVNNDSLAGLEIGLTLLGMLIYLKNDKVKLWHLGILVGIGLLTKLSTLFLVGLVPAAILLKWWRGKSAENKLAFRPLLQDLVAFALPALLLGSIWSIHSMQVYGFPDVFGQRQHNLVVADQARTADRIADIGWGSYLKQAVETTFNSFWGQFGWMALPLPAWMYIIFLALLVVGVSGLLLPIFRKSSPQTTESWRRDAWIILALTAFLGFLAYVYYNTEFLQLQGRYMFSAIIPYGIGLVLGVDFWRRLIVGRFPLARWLTAVPFLLLIPLDVYLILRIIEPLLRA